jgi:ribosomal protein L4
MPGNKLRHFLLYQPFNGFTVAERMVSPPLSEARGPIGRQHRSGKVHSLGRVGFRQPLEKVARAADDLRSPQAMGKSNPRRTTSAGQC